MIFRDPQKPPKPTRPGTPAPIPVRVAGNVSTSTTDGSLETGGNLDAQTALLQQIAALLAGLPGLTVSFNSAANVVTVASDALNPVTVTGQVSTDLIAVGGAPVHLGSAPSAVSVPVVIASDQAPISITPTALQAVTAADGAIATEGSTQDARALPDAPGSIVAQLRGANEQLAKLNEFNRQQLALTRAILAQLNAMGQQQGVLPAVDPASISPVLN